MIGCQRATLRKWLHRQSRCPLKYEYLRRRGNFDLTCVQDNGASDTRALGIVALLEPREYYLVFERDDATEAIVWKHASERELAQLATRHSVDDCKRCKDSFQRTRDARTGRDLRIGSSGREAELFAGFPPAQLLISFLPPLCNGLLLAEALPTQPDVCAPWDLPDAHEARLCASSSDQHATSVGIFSREEVAAIVDYVTNSYYRHFQLYKCIYTPYYHVHFVQREINDVQTPKTPRPLSQGFLHTVKPMPPGESLKEHGTEISAEILELPADE
ncbi:Flagellar C1a complex subunit C1a-32 [Phytophthora cactorum]|nr:Flagellar C1a complex subunit C1a-32 [Phytophthora cactorum]